MQIYEETEKQREAVRLLSGKAKHCLLYGGSRSGKTVILVNALLFRSLKTKSRHVILRKYFNHVKQSIWYDTLPKVMDLCFPKLKEMCKFDRSDWFVQFPNKSEIWIGGLDDKERTEKILGREFTTIFFNECSEIGWEARNIAMTRLSEKNPLTKRAYYDCNPPKRSHWTHKLFIEKVDPLSDFDLDDADNYASLLMNPVDNVQNIDPDYISGVLAKLPPLLRDRFLLGLFVSDDSDIFRPEWIKKSEPFPDRSDLCLVVQACDPAMSEKDTACETSITTLGLDYDGLIHETETVSGRWSWRDLKAACRSAHDAHKPDYFGVERVAAQRWLGDELKEEGINVVQLEADADKIRRAITVTDLFEQDRVRVNDPKTRKQLLEFPPQDEKGLRDRVDSFVYALRLIKLYGGGEFVKPVDKYKGLDARSKQFWQNHFEEMDEKPSVGATFGRIING